ncbi:hypothetical protein BH780_gp115 [Bacillus phage Eldridge]|uniref:Uncharacterized protein n=1 Tax=Bacillus phage Eldridge TaxID=1776293 RepID=A0A120HUP0_9CAUD|nr:hypothetical protein BH780_gp115 [Bacillus phage Eldridge]AMB18698.1 hypothetical protein Eldridge_0118 [Bacillus phage Eldridge]
MFSKQENNKRRLVKQLKEVKKNADKGHLTHADHKTLVNAMIQLTNEVYGILIAEEKTTLETKCGVCNEGIDISHCAFHKMEEDGSVTSYHMHHEGQLKSITPCTDCGQHRLFCDECKEVE